MNTKRQEKNLINQLLIMSGKIKNATKMENMPIKAAANENYIIPVSEELNDKSQSKKYLKYNKHIQLSINANEPIFKIFGDYFNYLREHEDEQEKNNFKILGFIAENGDFQDSISYTEFGLQTATLIFEDILINFVFNKYKKNCEIIHYIALYSEKTTKLKGEYIYNTIFDLAIESSELKGNFLIFPEGSLDWEIGDLENRTFNDIYLPNNLLNDLKLYAKVAIENQQPMRYLLVGAPGTGKTESCLVLANELNKVGTTIIKTSICRAIYEKVQLAELLAPSIIIFDDIDLALGSRSRGGFSEMLRKFLDVLDGTNKINKNVGIIATTNAAHLLDLAAQRPGRFDQIMIFDSITADNVKNIILKSLRMNFNIDENSEIAKTFTTKKIIDKYYTSKVSGAHIYNNVNMIKIRLDKLKNRTLTETWILDEIQKEIETYEKIKKQTDINDKYNSSSNSILGFKTHSDEEVEIEDCTEAECDHNGICVSK